MSRRARKRSGKTGSPLLGRLLIVVLVLVILLVAGGYFGIRSYLHSESLRLMLAGQSGDALNADAEFDPFQWHGRHVRTDRFTADGDAMVTRLLAEGVSTDVGFGGFSRGVWELRGGVVRRLEAELDLTNSFDEAAELMGDASPGIGPTKIDKKKEGGWLPSKAELIDAEFSNIDLRALTTQGVVSFLGVRAKVESEDPSGDYSISLNGGVLKLPYEFVPPLEFDHADLRAGEEAVYLKSLKASAWDTALLTATGEWDKEFDRAVLDGQLNGIPTSKLLRGDWVRRVSGSVDVPFLIRREGDSLSAEGKIQLENGVLTVLPILDVLASYADTGRFRILPLHEAHCDWRWRDDTLRFSKIVLHSEGLAKLEGNLVIRGRQLDGVFRLGIAPGTLAHIPGAETVVFLPGENGLVWAPLRITGTLDDPKEDLSERLITAAGLRMFEVLPETGEQVLRFSHRLAEDVAPNAVQEGLRILDQGKDVIDDVNGVINGIFGSPIKPPKLPMIPE